MVSLETVRAENAKLRERLGPGAVAVFGKTPMTSGEQSLSNTSINSWRHEWNRRAYPPSFRQTYRWRASIHNRPVPTPTSFYTPVPSPYLPRLA